jgi:hypothetical protein
MSRSHDGKLSGFLPLHFIPFSTKLRFFFGICSHVADNLTVLTFSCANFYLSELTNYKYTSFLQSGGDKSPIFINFVLRKA